MESSLKSLNSLESLSSFVHLHIHSEYSLVDGLIRVEDLVEAADQNKSFAVAITDQNNLFAMVKFYQAAEEQGIKPIIGCEVWIENQENENEPYRMILLCQNEEGYHNLTELVSLSYVEGQKGEKPIIQKQWLIAKNQGLISIAVARESDVGMSLVSGSKQEAENLIKFWSSIFVHRFYLEITRTGQKEQEDYIKAIVPLAHKLECPLVATNNVRFLAREDYEAHEARVCVHQGITLNDPNRQKQFSEEQYLKTPEEMIELFSDFPEAIENTIEIAKRCNLEMALNRVFLPKFPVPKDKTIEQYLTHVAQHGLEKKLQSKIFTIQTISEKEYHERLLNELNVINSMGFAGYFLIVADFIHWAKENGVPVGPGRGSGAGSLVAFALDITGIDPLQYELLFERFLNPERVSMPDFDIDFCMEGRDRVIDYVANTYGRSAVSQIITFGTMAAKAVIRDVGRVLGHPYGFVDKIAKLIPLELGITLEKALKQEDALRQRYQEEEEVKLLIDLAKKLEGIVRNAGKHAGGVVIAPSKLTDFSPLYCDVNDGVLLTQFDKNDVETIGLVKFDFLGLRTLTIIDWATKTVNEMRAVNQEPPIAIEDIPLDDEKTFDLLRACHTTAVFQLESRGMKDLVRRLRPDIFEEIIQLGALFRPGPLQSGMVDDFINRKHGRSKPDYLHPKLTNILKPTYGIILYQEQVMQIAQVLAGYTLGAADLLRRAMGKKKPEEMAKQRDIFTKGAVLHGVDHELASSIFDLMEKFAGYGFNKSHSAAYAMLTYQTAWLKAHYPAAFMAAVLSSDMAHTDKIVIFVEECRLLHIPIIPPNINLCHYKFTVNSENQVLYGLGAIKGVGEQAINNMIEARTLRPFKDLFDFCARVDGRRVSRRTIEALIRSGAMDIFGAHRAQLMHDLEDAIQTSLQIAKNQMEGQVDLFLDAFSEEDCGIRSSKKSISPWPDSLVFEGEKETLGFYFSGHPLDAYQDELHYLTSSAIKNLRLDKGRRVTIAGLISNIRSLQTKKGDRMAFISLDDRSARQEIAVFSDLYRIKRELLMKDNLIFVEGELSIDDYTGGYKMRANEIFTLEEMRSRAAKSLEIELEETQISENFNEQLKKILSEVSGGNVAVKLIYQQNQNRSVLKLGEEWRIHPKQSLLEKLKSLCGVEKASFCY